MVSISLPTIILLGNIKIEIRNLTERILVFMRQVVIELIKMSLEISVRSKYWCKEKDNFKER
jgi:hypothetical protein